MSQINSRKSSRRDSNVQNNEGNNNPQYLNYWETQAVRIDMLYINSNRYQELLNTASQRNPRDLQIPEIHPEKHISLDIVIKECRGIRNIIQHMLNYPQHEGPEVLQQYILEHLMPIIDYYNRTYPVAGLDYEDWKGIISKDLAVLPRDYTKEEIEERTDLKAMVVRYDRKRREAEETVKELEEKLASAEK